PLLLLGPRDREDVLAAREQPRERDLRRFRTAPGGDRFQRLDELEVALEIAGLEARLLAADVVRGDVLDFPDVAGEEPAPERRVGDEADAELAACGKDLVLDVARPERILRLERGDGMHLVRAAKRIRPRLGKPEISHLAGLDELRHRAHRLLDR